MTDKQVIQAKQKRTRLIEEAGALLEKAKGEDRRQLTAAEGAKFDALHKEAEEIETDIKRWDRPVGIQRLLRGKRGFGDDGIGRGLLRTGEIRALAPEDRLADVAPGDPLPDGVQPEDLSLGRFVRGLVTGNWTNAEAEHRVMATTRDTLGGHLVPSPLSSRVIDLARAQARVIQAGAVTVVMEGHTLKLARLTADPSAGWKAENTDASVSDLNLDAVTLEAKVLMAVVKLSVELVEDAPNVSDVVERALAGALSVELDRAVLRGSGTGEEPLGINGQTGIQTIDMGANGAALTRFDEFSQAVENVLTVNGPSEGLAAIYAPRTAGDLDRFVDSQNQPLSSPPFFERLRKLVTSSIPVNLTKGTSSNATQIYVGDFRQVLIGVRQELRVEVSREASDSASSAFRALQVWIRAYLRADVVLGRADHLVLIDGVTPSP